MTSISSSTHASAYHLQTAPIDDVEQTYMAAGGETLEILAKEYGVSVQALKDANPNIPSATEPLSFGDQVNIPAKDKNPPTTAHHQDDVHTDTHSDDHKKTTSTSLMDIAKNEYAKHVKEVPGHGANKNIIKYLNSTGLKGTSYAKTDATAWCSAFVNWTVEKAGLKGTNSGWADSWLKWGKPVSLKHAKPGDVVVVQTGKGPKDQHVGFFVKQKHGVVTLLGGNQHNSVSYSTYSAHSVLGVREPKHKPQAKSHQA